MSLKALVQLFAEKFLVSKKESVQDWTYPDLGNSVEISIPSGATSVEYTPPSNGCIQVVIRNGTSVGVYSAEFKTTNSSATPRVYFDNMQGWYCNVYRVQKGRKVVLTFTKLDPSSWVAFFPFN